MRKIVNCLSKMLIFILIIFNVFMVYSICNDINFNLVNIDDIPFIKNMTSVEYIENNLDSILFNEDTVSQGFQNIKLGMDIKTVEQLVGKPDRISLSTYGFNWHIYNKYKNIFFMIGIDNNEVVGIYSNTTNNKHLNEIALDKTDMNYVREKFKVLESKDKEIQSDVLITTTHTLTLFYDIHKNHTVTSFEVVKNKYYYKRKVVFYLKDMVENSPIYTKELEEELQLQMFDLVNATREKFGLKRLKYDSDKAHKSSDKHALDMKNNNYFDHNNLNGESAFDRMKNEGLNCIYAGENLAGGHISAIYAHEALMNSKGHRDIILGKKFKKVGIGVEFGGHYCTYYVQNYYR